MNDDQVLSEIQSSLERSRRREERNIKRQARSALAQRALADLSTLRKRSSALPHQRFKNADHIEDELTELVALACRALKSTVDALGDRQQELQRKLAKARADLRAQGGILRAMDAFELKAAARMGLVGEKQAEEELARRRSELPTLQPVLGPTPGGGAGWLPCARSGCWTLVFGWSESFPFCPEHDVRDEPFPRLAGFNA
jgi:hypothetical protein